MVFMLTKISMYKLFDWDNQLIDEGLLCLKPKNTILENTDVLKSKSVTFQVCQKTDSQNEWMNLAHKHTPNSSKRRHMTGSLLQMEQ